MKKQLLFVAIIVNFSLQAQIDKKSVGTPQPMLISFNGGNYNGNVVDVDAPPDMVENVLKEKFFKQGVKPKEINGFLVFRNVKMEAIDPLNNLDAFIKIERKSRKEKETSTVSFITAKPGEIADEKLKSGSVAAVVTTSAIAGGFLSGLSPDIDDKVFQKTAADKQAGVHKAEKKLKDLQDDQASLEKKIKNLQDDLESNRKDQENQTAELEKLRKDLDDYTSKKH